MNGGWLDDRCHRHGDHHNRPSVDTGGLQHCLLYALPFGQKVVSRAEYTGRQDIGTGPLGILGNVLWLVLAGWWLALAHVVTAILLAITIVGIPFAWAPLGVAKVMQCLCAYFPIVESAAACSAALSRLRRE